MNSVESIFKNLEIYTNQQIKQLNESYLNAFSSLQNSKHDFKVSSSTLIPVLTSFEIYQGFIKSLNLFSKYFIYLLFRRKRIIITYK